MKELIERLREDYCSCIDGYKSRGMTDPQCSSCDSKDWREECADVLERLTAENLRLAGEVSNRNSRALAGDTATKQFDAMYEDIESLTAERDALRADAERLNWMEDALKCYFFQIQSQPSGAYVVQGYGKKLRAAIDAAIAGEKT